MREDWTIWGISELSGWLGHSNPTSGSPSGHDAEDCLDGHLACGIRHVAWDLGRSVLMYHSDLPGATCAGLRPEPDGLGARERASEGIYAVRCQLRAALRHARAHDLVLYGRLCMNRHYAPGSPHRGRFAELHLEWCEQRKDGWVDASRLCYAIPEVRRERVEILREAAEIGVDGLQLDFCRQPPMVRYHPAFVGPYRQRIGSDPRELSLADRHSYLAWCAYRAESVTHLLRELKAALDPFREAYRRPVPVQVRVPNDGLEANLVAGLDVATWCAEGLVDELALTELRWLAEYTVWSDRPYIALGRTHDIPVYASSNCLPLQGGAWSGKVNPRGVSPLGLARRALQSYQDGAQGIAVYQSDTGVQMAGVQDAIRAMAEPEGALEAFIGAEGLRARYPETPQNAHYGIDNHSAAFAQFRATCGPEPDGI